MAVLAKRDRLDRMVTGASDGIVLLDPKERVEVWNPAMEELAGIDASEAVGRPLDDLVSAATAGGVQVDPAGACLSGGLCQHG